MVLRILPAWRSRRDSVPVAGRRVLITGGSSGIGLACARRLARAEARVVLLARGDEALRRAAASFEPMPETIAADVTDPDAMRAALERAAHLLGGLDAVVANAGAAAYGPFSPVLVALVAPGLVDTPFWRRARTADGRLPPRVLGADRPDEVAAEVARALDSPRGERSVGALMAAWAFLDAVGPNVVLRALGPVARLGWRRRGRRPASPGDALAEPTRAPATGGGLPNRPSVLVTLRKIAGIGR